MHASVGRSSGPRSPGHLASSDGLIDEHQYSRRIYQDRGGRAQAMPVVETDDQGAPFHRACAGRSKKPAAHPMPARCQCGQRRSRRWKRSGFSLDRVCVGPFAAVQPWPSQERGRGATVSSSRSAPTPPSFPAPTTINPTDRCSTRIEPPRVIADHGDRFRRCLGYASITPAGKSSERPMCRHPFEPPSPAELRRELGESHRGSNVLSRQLNRAFTQFES